MTLDEIKELVQVVIDSGVAELEVERGESRVRIRRSLTNATQEIIVPAAATPAPVPAPAATAAVAAASTGAGQPAAAESAPSAGVDSDAGLILVKSPIVGTFYECASPGSPAFVRVGDAVKPGQVLCIIESMKLMNEIQADSAGVIVGRLVENGSPVEYGEALFSMRPA